RRPDDGGRRGRLRGRDLADMVLVHVLRGPHRDPPRAPAGAVRGARARSAVSRLSAAGVTRAALVFGALALFPFAFPQHWVVNLAIFTVMYAGLASSWNLLGGFSGYLSLGHAAFFGIGAYAIGILFTHIGVGAGYKPFLVLPGV